MEACVNKSSPWNWYMHANYEVEWGKEDLNLNPNTKTETKLWNKSANKSIDKFLLKK